MQKIAYEVHMQIKSDFLVIYLSLLSELFQILTYNVSTVLFKSEYLVVYNINRAWTEFRNKYVSIFCSQKIQSVTFNFTLIVCPMKIGCIVPSSNFSIMWEAIYKLDFFCVSPWHGDFSMLFMKTETVQCCTWRRRQFLPFINEEGNR